MRVWKCHGVQRKQKRQQKRESTRSTLRQQKMRMHATAPLAISVLLLGALNSEVLGCVPPPPVTHQGPWIGGHSYWASNPLITTDQQGVLVSNLVVYDDEGNEENEAMIVIDANDGSVKQLTSDDDFILTPYANITEDVTAGYTMNVVVAENNRTATVEITSPDGGDVLEFTLRAPDGDTELQNEYYYKLVVSAPLNTAYIMYADYYPEDITHYAVLDLSNPNSVSRLEAFSFYLARWPVDQYEDLQIMSMWNGDSCYGRQHLYYNESHIVSADGMGYYTHTRAIESGETNQDNSYYFLQTFTEAAESDDSSSGDDDWYTYERRYVTNYTLWERNVITGENIREIMLSMDDIQAIADELVPTNSSSSTSNSEDEDSDADAQVRKFVRSGKSYQGNSKKKPTGKMPHFDDGTSTVHIQTTLLFEFFQRHNSAAAATTARPKNDDIGALIGATLEFFRQVFRKKSHSFVDWTMTNVKPIMDQNKPNQFTLEFISNIVFQEGEGDHSSMTARDAANIMSRADYKKYIGHFARGSSSSSPFHSTFKVHFKGITDNSIA